MSQSGAQVAGASGAGRGAWLGWFLGSLALVAALLLFVVMLSRARTQDERITALDQQVAQKGEELAQAQRKSEADTRKLSDSQMQVDSLTRSLTLERSARQAASSELDVLRAQKGEFEAVTARIKEALLAKAATEQERDQARAEVERLSVSKSALEEQVSALTARVEAQAGTIASLEGRLREALAERDRLLAGAGAQATAASSGQSMTLVQRDSSSYSTVTTTAGTTGAAGRGHSTAVFSRAGTTDDGPDPNPLTNFRNQMLLQEAGAGPRPMVISRVRGLEPDLSAYAPGVAPSPVAGAGALASAGEVAAASPGQTRVSSVGNNSAQGAVGALGIVPDAIGNFFTMIGEGLDSAFTGRTYVRPGEPVPAPATQRARPQAAPSTWGVSDAHGG